MWRLVTEVIAEGVYTMLEAGKRAEDEGLTFD